jgi:hypothetical protein
MGQPDEGIGRKMSKANYARWILIILLTLVTGVAAGKFGNRWGKPVDLVAAGKRVAEMPVQPSGWAQHGKTMPIDEQSAEMLKCSGSAVRDFNALDDKTGEKIEVSLLVGPPGTMAVHTPDVCFKGLNFESIGEKQQLTVPGTTAELRAESFRFKGLEGGQRRVLLAWNAGERWEAPKNPRIAFMGAPLLYKLMVAIDVSDGANVDATDELLRGFLKKLLPELDKVIQEKELHPELDKVIQEESAS